MQPIKTNLYTPNTLSFDTSDGRRRISGYAAVFYDPADAGSTYSPQEGVQLRIARGAFDAALRKPEKIQALMYHDKGRPVGMYGENLQLEADYKGLRFSLDLPNTTDGNDAWELVGGNGGPRIIKGMSFTANRGYDKWTKENGLDVLTFVRWADLTEVTLTPSPAFVGTSVSWSEEAAAFVRREAKLHEVTELLNKLKK